MSRRSFTAFQIDPQRHPLKHRATVRRMLGYAFAGIVAIVLGCKSDRISQYVSPKITGRVVDANTQEPLRNVQVQRVLGRKRAMDLPRGSQPLEQWNSTRTNGDGEFVLDSQRELTPFRHVGWYAVTIAFDLAGYESRTIEFSASDATNQPGDEPLIGAGNIRMQRLEK